MLSKSNCLMIGSFILILSLTQSVFGQSTATEKSGCSKLDTDKDSVFITFERLDRNKGEIWLRLSNNLSCDIVLEGPQFNPRGTEYEKFFRLEKEQVSETTNKTSYIFDPPVAGVMLTDLIYYDYEDIRKNKRPEHGNLKGDRKGNGFEIFSSTWPIPPGRSVIFNVKLEYLKKGYLISVPFHYEWESIGEGLIAHRVYLVCECLPAEITEIKCERIPCV